MFARKTLLTFSSSFIYYLLYGITLLLAVNKFLPADFGYLKVATSLMGFFTLFSDFSFSLLHTKLMAEKKETQNDYFTTYFIIKIILSSISSIILYFVISFQFNQNIIPNENYQIWIIILSYFTSLVQSFNLLFSSSFIAKLKIAKKEVAFLSSRIIGSVFILIIIFTSNNFLLYVCGSLISEVILLFLHIILSKNFRITRPKRDLIHKYFYLGAILIPPKLILTFITFLGPLLYIEFYGDYELLGVFEIIISIFIMIQLLEGTIRTLLIPNFSSLISENKFEELKRLIESFEKYVTILNSLIILGGFITGPFLIKIFLGDFYYENGLFVFYGSLISLLSFGVFVPYSALIFADMKMKIYLITIGSNLAFVLIFWIFFIPTLGIIAIDLPKWIYWIPNAIFIRYYCNKYFNIGKMSKKIINNYLILIIFVSISVFLISFVDYNEIQAILYTIIILITYILILFVFKILNKQDLNFFVKIFNSKEMINYIKTEIKEDFEKK